MATTANILYGYGVTVTTTAGTISYNVPANYITQATTTFEWVPFYPRIWRTGSLNQDIQTLTNVYRTYQFPEDVPEMMEIQEMGTETGQLGYVQQARGGYYPANPPQPPPPGLYGNDPVREAEERRARQRTAAETAERLLVSCLSDEQIREWTARKEFTVETNGRRYRIGSAGAPVYRIDRDGNILFSYCIHIYGVPRCDEYLGFKLLLDCDEDDFLRTANATITTLGMSKLAPSFQNRARTPVPIDVQKSIVEAAEDIRLALAS